MAKLIYATPVSIDGFIGNGEFEWSNPGDDGHAFFSEKTAPIGTYLYGRRMYEVMSFWENPEGGDGDMMEFSRVWKSAEKVVYSGTLKSVSTSKTRLERSFDPAAILDMKQKASKDISISGPTLAAQAFRAGIVDEIQLFVVPKLIGNGISIFPKDILLDLELVEEKQFKPGWMFLRYQVKY